VAVNASGGHLPNIVEEADVHISRDNDTNELARGPIPVEQGHPRPPKFVVRDLSTVVAIQRNVRLFAAKIPAEYDKYMTTVPDNEILLTKNV
jgi:hypothetical protein